MTSLRLPYSGRHHAEPVVGAPALCIENLFVSYPGARSPALNGVGISIPTGVRAALVGANGSGKSTLLKTVAGLLPVRSGDVRIYGNPVGACHHRVAYLPQRGEIDWRFPVNARRLVLGGRHVHLGWMRRPGKRDRQIVEEAMERLGITSLADRQIGELSGGQQQRVLLARALAQKADLLLLDEPFAAMDAQTTEVVFEVLEELRSEGKTLLVATHYLDRLEREFDGALYLSNGRLVEPEPGMFVGGDFREEAAWAGS
ncbi:MAG: ABC transporter ATP-binding protein [Rubrobacteraceae bacterium]